VNKKSKKKGRRKTPRPGWVLFTIEVPREFAQAVRNAAHKRSIIKGTRVGHREIIVPAVLEYPKNKDVKNEFRLAKEGE